MEYYESLTRTDTERLKFLLSENTRKTQEKHRLKKAKAQEKLNKWLDVMASKFDVSLVAIENRRIKEQRKINAM